MRAQARRSAIGPHLRTPCSAASSVDTGLHSIDRVTGVVHACPIRYLGPFRCRSSSQGRSRRDRETPKSLRTVREYEEDFRTATNGGLEAAENAKGEVSNLACAGGGTRCAAGLGTCVGDTESLRPGHGGCRASRYLHAYVLHPRPQAGIAGYAAAPHNPRYDVV